MSRTQPGLLAAFYGDDFTGSVDALLQFTRCGLRGRLFVGLPGQAELRDAASSCDVVGVAGIARSLPTEAMAAELEPVLEQLAALHPRVVQYKACSTADSSPRIGSLGRVIELGRAIVSPGTVPVLLAQPDFGRYTVFGHHFASEDGTVYRLDRQPTMSAHPSTPMNESDLAVHLGAQTDLPITSLPFTAYGSDEEIVCRLADSDAAAVVLDALSDDQLKLLGRAILRLPDPVFAVGSGGLSRAIASAAARRRGGPAGSGAERTGPAVESTGTGVGQADSGSGQTGAVAVDRAGPQRPDLHRPDPHQPGPFQPGPHRPGPALAVSGSRSARTRLQLEAAREAGWAVLPLPVGPAIVPGGPLDDPTEATAARVAELLASGRSVALSAHDADLSGLDPAEALPAIAAAGAGVVAAAVEQGATGRVIVCGGDTSSRLTRLLGVRSLSIAANPWDNVVLLTAHAPGSAIDGIELLLKGGQVGAEDLFERVRALGG